MKRTHLLIPLLILATAAQGAMLTHGTVGAGHGNAILNRTGNPCPTSSLLLNFDGSAEDATCWQYAGIAPPYYGAFAECYSFTGGICGIELILTSLGYPSRPCDVYVWGDEGGRPGSVLTVTLGVDPGPVATWPNVSTHDLAFADPPEVNGSYWTGYWADFSQQPCGYFIAIDDTGPGGCPMTNIAPGIGYPTGWNSVNLLYGGVRAIGIGSWAGTEPVPVQESAWGRIKSLYH